MSNLYVVCELGAEKGRIFLGALNKEGLTVSLAGEFQDLIITHKENTQWDVSRIYEQVLRAIHGIVAQEEPVRGITFFSSETDALLFETDVALLAPATRPTQAAAMAELKKLQAKMPIEELYAETGVHPAFNSMLCQLAAEPSRRLKKTLHALPLP